MHFTVQSWQQGSRVESSRVEAVIIFAQEGLAGSAMRRRWPDSSNIRTEAVLPYDRADQPSCQ